MDVSMLVNIAILTSHKHRAELVGLISYLLPPGCQNSTARAVSFYDAETD